MQNEPFDLNTLVFIVRLWVERSESGEFHGEWRGSIENVTSATRRYIRDLQGIADFIRPYLETAGAQLNEQWWNDIQPLMDDASKNAGMAP